MKTANYWIEKLNLKKHPEGGYFKEVYRSSESIKREGLPLRYASDRKFATSIFFLLNGDNFSSFHRLKSDETWHFYQGSTLELYILKSNEELITYRFGSNPDLYEHFQVTIPANHWFGARVIDSNSYSLVGCTMSPGFDFDDFELANRANLLEEYPQQSKIIKELTFN